MPPVDSAAPKGSSRPLPRWLLILAAALLVARIGTGIYEYQHPPLVPESDTPAQSQGSGQRPGHAAANRVVWVPAEMAEGESRRTGKPILYDFSAEWCGPCKRMEAELFTDPAAASQISQLFVPVMVIDRQQEESHNPPLVEKLQSAYSINSFPTLIVARPGKREYESQSGYGGPEHTLRWLTGARIKVGGGSTADSTLHS